VVVLIWSPTELAAWTRQSPAVVSDCQIHQVDISPDRMDSNRPVACARCRATNRLRRFSLADDPQAWKHPDQTPRGSKQLAERKQHNAESMAARLAKIQPMDFHSALRAIRDVLAGNLTFTLSMKEQTLSILVVTS